MIEVIWKFMHLTAKYLFDAHPIFRINPFFILYLIVGPAIICYMKPHMQSSQRNLLIFSAIVCSFVFYILGVSHAYMLEWHQYEECVQRLQLDSLNYNPLCPSPGWQIHNYHAESTDSISHESYAKIIFILVFIFIFNPFMSFPLSIWLLWHRKTIQALGDKFVGKDNLLIFALIPLWGPLLILIFCIV